MGFLVKNEKAINKNSEGINIENKLNEKYLNSNEKKNFFHSFYDLNQKDNDNHIYTYTNLSASNFFSNGTNEVNSRKNYYSEGNINNLNNMNNEKLLINKLNFNDNKNNLCTNGNKSYEHGNNYSFINENMPNKADNLFFNVNNDLYVSQNNFNNSNYSFLNERNLNKLKNESVLNENISKQFSQNLYINNKYAEKINNIDKNIPYFLNNAHKINNEYSTSNNNNLIKLNSSFLKESNLINGNNLNKKYIKTFNYSTTEKNFKSFFNQNIENSSLNVNNEEQNEAIRKKIKKKIDENDYLFHAINELLEVGLKNECIPLFERLQQNLFFLVMLANIPNEKFDDIESSSSDY